MDFIEKYFYEVEKYLMYLMVLTIPIDTLPERYSFPTALRNLHFTFLVFAIIIGIIFFIKNRNIYNEIPKSFKIYLGLCLIWPILCTILGIINFPYWNGQADDFLRNTGFIQKVSFFYPAILNNANLLHLKYGFSLILNIIHDLYVPLFGIPFVFYLMFKDKDSAEILNVVSQSATIFACILALYSIVEIPWLLTGDETCEYILKSINTLLYDPTSNAWWPPFLWPGQLRSYMYEPSFFGIIAMFVLPLLWYRAFGLQEKKVIPLLILFTWMMYLTKSRTAQVIFLGELFLLILLSVYAKYKYWLCSIGKILLATICAFIIFLSVPFMIGFVKYGYKLDSNQSLSVAASKYFEEDVSSIGIKKTRSNMSRWGNMVATVTVGIKHPIFGVGNGLQHMYISDCIPNFASDDPEIKFWIKRLYQDGFMKAGFPNLNSYSVIFACYGLIGLILYIMPSLYILVNIYRYRKSILVNIGTICLIVAYCGQLACLLCNHFMYTYPISMASIACLLSKNKKSHVNN